MNIVFLCRRFHPHVGGVEKHVESISLELIKKGYEVTVITEQYETSLNIKDSYKQIAIYRIPRDIANSKKFLWQWMLSHKTLFKAADVIHAHDVFWWYLPLKFRIKTPIYTTFHGWEGSYPPTTKAKLWRKMSEKLSKGNICVGDFIEKWYGTRPNVVTYGATDQKLLPVGAKDRLLVFGRLSKDNDVEMVIEALKLIKKQVPNLKVTFLGDGDLAWEAKEVGNVLGFQEDIGKYLTEVHWVIASSYLSILDAIASGRTVFSVYSNPLKADYLKMMPIAEHLQTSQSSKQLAATFMSAFESYKEHTEDINKSYAWVSQQTWEKLTKHYINLWTNGSYTFSYKNFMDT